LYSPKTKTIHQYMALLQVALVSIPPRKFVLSPCWYYRLQEIEKYDFSVVPNGITSIPNLIQIRSAVLKLNHAYGKTDTTSPICVNFMHIEQGTNNNAQWTLTHHKIFTRSLKPAQVGTKWRALIYIRVLYTINYSSGNLNGHMLDSWQVWNLRMELHTQQKPYEVLTAKYKID
jgi:hypothetical protein